MAPSRLLETLLVRAFGHSPRTCSNGPNIFGPEEKSEGLPDKDMDVLADTLADLTGNLPFSNQLTQPIFSRYFMSCILVALKAVTVPLIWRLW